MSNFIKIPIYAPMDISIEEDFILCRINKDHISMFYDGDKYDNEEARCLIYLKGGKVLISNLTSEEIDKLL